ncbi:hypothetical protein CDV55_107294 [Aspergillus turcosus]|nr:hypothetical protein CDV55_107294 [Aspergillus turcosus]
MAQSTVSLLNLPMEIHLLIVENADYASKVSLYQTNAYFRTIVDVNPPGDAAQQSRFGAKSITDAPLARASKGGDLGVTGAASVRNVWGSGNSRSSRGTDARNADAEEVSAMLELKALLLLRRRIH